MSNFHENVLCFLFHGGMIPIGYDQIFSEKPNAHLKVISCEFQGKEKRGEMNWMNAR